MRTVHDLLTLMTRAALEPQTARRLAQDIVDDLFMAGYTPLNQADVNGRIYLWLGNHGLDQNADLDLVTDPTVRVTGERGET